MTAAKLQKKVNRIQELQAQADAIQKEIDLLKSQIKDGMQEAGVDEFTGEGFKVTWKEVFSNRIDAKALKATMPDVYSQFLTIGVTRRFCIM